VVFCVLTTASIRAQSPAAQITLEDIGAVCSGQEIAKASGGHGKIGSAGYEFEVTEDKELRVTRSGQLIAKIERFTYQEYQKCLGDLSTLIRPRSEIRFATCGLPAFGLKGWSKEETLQGTSGWRGGGYNQGAYCADYKNSVVGGRKLQGAEYKLETVNSGEEGRWTGPFGRTREYNYHCTVKLYTGPLYNERTDERCGLLK
jgi:hypothetical protein